VPGGDGHDRAGDQGDAELDDLELDAFDRVTFTDEELTRLALDAEPFDPFDPAVQQFAGAGDPARFPVIPEWYMPAPGIPRSRARAAVMLGFAVSLVVITIGGFCVTLGVPEFVWQW
jgi:hypothetical protein